MNLIRTLMSVFFLILLSLTIAGWIWAGGLPEDKMNGARLALGLSGLAVMGAVVLLWKESASSSADGSE